MAKGRKSGGRKKGTPNKSTVELKEYLDSIDLCLPEMIFELLPMLDDAKKVETLLRLMEYVYPKRKVADITQVDRERLSFVEAIQLLKL